MKIILNSLSDFEQILVRFCLVSIGFCVFWLLAVENFILPFYNANNVVLNKNKLQKGSSSSISSIAQFAAATRALDFLPQIVSIDVSVLAQQNETAAIYSENTQYGIESREKVHEADDSSVMVTAASFRDNVSLSSEAKPKVLAQ